MVSTKLSKVASGSSNTDQEADTIPAGGAHDAPKPEEITIDTEQRSQDSQEQGLVTEAVDPVFGNEDGAAIHYRTMEWYHASTLMLAETISLGVLALPQCIAILGLVPGILLITIIGLIASYTGLIIGQFKEAFPLVHSFADAGELICGKVGKEIMAVSQVLILVFIQAAHVLSFSIAMNALTDHGACSVVFSFIGVMLCFILGLPRKFQDVSYLSIVSCVSVVIAVTVAMIAIAIQKPDYGHALAIQPDVSVVKGLGPVLNIVLAYAGHVAFFPICAELKKPHDFPKAIACTQIIACSFYVLIGAIIYTYAGPHVASPALGSASPLVRKISFGLAIPTIIIAGVVNGSVACKYVYIRVWKGTNVIHRSDFKSLGSWVGICAALWGASWVIAMAIPQFNLLLGFIAALFCSWFSYTLPAILWLYMNQGKHFSSKRKGLVTTVNIFIIFFGLAICSLGLWSSGVALAQGAAGKVFSCENNWKLESES
ncbi:hypothetical protein GQ43DRAFT_475333 [Delitschia confertaspora ATCC 74209]|uniref:Amino acid transporter transmembrane domain-containing protein n=1 Tax=Delitschia confertaspora ATCC 74209 TaxID=1513339 RepID=A0A9P4JDQ8_9PLEO|nr:hypothetical protein GQ43DRAFT_475333 [Delitschia confertaspora ATCC 74209]